VISVSDGILTAALPAFSIQVQAPPDHAPVIGGTPPQARRRRQLFLHADASDPDGDTLTFSVANRPSWASFSSPLGSFPERPTTGTSASSRAS